ncbi:MAG: ribonuclease D [Gammaproteobacteria bacterium]|nr:ribonuclease D [Gammaproteobacteria bacterium]
MPDYTLIDRPAMLCPALAGERRIGLDTEFMREKTFFAELCLVQIAVDDSLYCVDPLAGDRTADPSLEQFWDCAMQATWVAHSARQDIEVIYQSADRMPLKLFDTQIAASLTGLATQLGYAALVQELFGIEIAKTHTRADWSRRPLSDAVLQYAAEDVQYLLPAQDLLLERLEQLGRRNWAEEDSARLLDTSLYDIDPKLAVSRLKGARNLRGRRRAAAARLAVWRETEALRRNRPRQWIVKDAVLIELAKTLPTELATLKEFDGLAEGLIRRAGMDILGAISSSDGDDTNYQPPSRPQEADKALLKVLQREVAECAADLGLAAETLAAKRDLTAIVLDGNGSSKVLEGWRHAVIGERLESLIQASG